MARVPTRPVQVRLPEADASFLAGLAAETGMTKSAIVADALGCLRRSRLEAAMEAGYRDLAGEHDDLVRAALQASLPVVPD